MSHNYYQYIHVMLLVVYWDIVICFNICLWWFQYVIMLLLCRVVMCCFWFFYDNNAFKIMLTCAYFEWIQNQHMTALMVVWDIITGSIYMYVLVSICDCIFDVTCCWCYIRYYFILICSFLISVSYIHTLMTQLYHWAFINTTQCEGNTCVPDITRNQGYHVWDYYILKISYTFYDAFVHNKPVVLHLNFTRLTRIIVHSLSV